MGPKIICNTTISSGATWQKRKEIYPKSLWKFLFLGRDVDRTLLWSISAIESKSMTPTKKTMRQTQPLSDYIATQEDAVIKYTGSHMKSAFHINASYLSEPKARSRAGGHLFLSNKATITQNNSTILNIAHIIKQVSCLWNFLFIGRAVSHWYAQSVPSHHNPRLQPKR